MTTIGIISIDYGYEWISTTITITIIPTNIYFFPINHGEFFVTSLTVSTHPSKISKAAGFPSALVTSQRGGAGRELFAALCQQGGRKGSKGIGRDRKGKGHHWELKAHELGYDHAMIMRFSSCYIMSCYMEVSINGGTPKYGWFIRGNPMNMDDYLGYPCFRKLPLLYCSLTKLHVMF